MVWKRTLGYNHLPFGFLCTCFFSHHFKGPGFNMQPPASPSWGNGASWGVGEFSSMDKVKEHRSTCAVQMPSWLAYPPNHSSSLLFRLKVLSRHESNSGIALGVSWCLLRLLEKRHFCTDTDVVSFSDSYKACSITLNNVVLLIYCLVCNFHFSLSRKEVKRDLCWLQTC